MRNYVVSYYLWDFYHTYTVCAENEIDAAVKAVIRIPDNSKPGLHDFKVECAEGR